ncbi:MAG: translation elongation factor-like protein [Candidatus Paceibacterota bacterium]|jgi:putative protease|nr:translation elongation factor-like protein [Candidatus Paceibacterota bacterium]
MEEKLIGKITHYFNKIQVAIIELTEEIKIGDKIHVKGHNTDFEQDITSMQIDRVDVEKAKKGDAIGLKVDEKVREGDEVYLILP